MKRLLTGLLLLMLLPVCALAAPETPYAPETVIHTTQLSEAALALIDVIYPAVTRGEETIELPKGTRYDDAVAATQSLCTDYPELFHLGNTWRIGYLQDTPDIAGVVMPSYTMDMEAYNAMLPELLHTTRQLVGQVIGGEADRAETLHDGLCAHATYVADEEINHTAYGAIMLGRAQCEGYSQGLALMFRMAGIPCGVTVGETIDSSGVVEQHSWNVAMIGGEATLIDATWNDQDASGCNPHWYYGLTSEMMAADHTVSPEFVVPACTSTAANWHARRGLLIAEAGQLYEALLRFSGFGEVSMRFADKALYEDFLCRTNEWIGEFNASYPQEVSFYGSYSVYADDPQLCVMLRVTD